jgi:NADPH:quinone reductase-like Zn-dependent oxidoreductase
MSDLVTSASASAQPCPSQECGIFWGSYTCMSIFQHPARKAPHPPSTEPAKNPKRLAEVWQELLALLASGKLKPVLFTGYTLDEGLDDLEHRRTWGKAVVRVREPPVPGKL